MEHNIVKVFQSCKTKEQIETACKYADLLVKHGIEDPKYIRQFFTYYKAKFGLY